MKDVARRDARERLGPRDDGLGRLGSAVVEEDAAELEREARAKRLVGRARCVRLRSGEPEACLVALAAKDRAAAGGEEERDALRRRGHARNRRTRALAALVERRHDASGLGREQALSWCGRHSAP